MDLITLTDDEARDLLAAVYAEVQRRDTIAQAPAQAEVDGDTEVDDDGGDRSNQRMRVGIAAV